MGKDHVLEQRRQTLEEAFFHEESQRQLEALRSTHQLELAKVALEKASGITNQAILERLLDLDVHAETVAALALLPLIQVVWADGHLDDKERKAVLTAAKASGLNKGTVEYDLLESWLSRRPDQKLRDAWQDYIEGLCEQLNQEDRDSLKTEWLGRARTVAEASGGVLGLGSKISREEAQVLEDMERAFQPA
jgi:hypothetical protein